MFVTYLLVVLSYCKKFLRQTHLQQNGLHDCELLCIKTLKVFFWKYCSFFYRNCVNMNKFQTNLLLHVWSLCCFCCHVIITWCLRLSNWSRDLNFLEVRFYSIGYFNYRALPATLNFLRVVKNESYELI